MARPREDGRQPRRGLSRPEAARYVGCSPAAFDALVREGRMPQPVILEGEEVFDLVKLDHAFDRLSGGIVNPWDRAK